MCCLSLFSAVCIVWLFHAVIASRFCYVGRVHAFQIAFSHSNECLVLNHQVNACWRREFKFETTANGQLLSDVVAVRVAFAMSSGVTVCADMEDKSFSVSTTPDSSESLISALVFTKSLPILGSPLGVRVSVVGNATEVAGGVVQQAQVSTSPPRVRNPGIDLMLDMLLEDDAEGPGQLRVSVVRPQALQSDLEISRVEVSAGALL